MTPADQDRGARSPWIALLVLASAVFAVARLVDPDPSGHGTHTQLGLPPCGVFAFTGLRCPGCGLTTAFAHMVRLDVGSAMLANPFGVVLFSCLLVMIPISVLALRHRWSLSWALQHVLAQRMAVVLLFAAVVSWVARTAADW